MNATSSATSSSRLKAGRSGTCEPVTSRRLAEMIRLQRVLFAACLACSPALSIVGVTPEKSRSVYFASDTRYELAPRGANRRERLRAMTAVSNMSPRLRATEVVFRALESIAKRNVNHVRPNP
jgi:hypothetical protein